MYRTLVVFACACSARPPVPTANVSPIHAPEVVAIDSGLIRGATVHGTGDGAEAALAWKGIPYAAPPIGELRWRPPSPAPSWPGVRETTGFGYACVQAGDSRGPDDTAMGSEDCLTLNVWRPLHADQPLPVMVFVHGGYFTWGSSSFRKMGVDLYDGTHLAVAGDVVVVTLNYRVGPFGFLAHAALADEDPRHSTGDYGLLDQLAALSWVQRNIAALGGDPSRVTLFGQSAGAISSAALFASPLAHGLFQRVIMHSGNADAMPLAQAERTGTKLAARLGCTGDSPEVTACLRAKSATAIASAVPASFATEGVKFAPVIEGWVLPDSPLRLVERGEHNHVPLIVGTTANEFSTMVRNFIDGPLATAEDYAAILARHFPPKLAQLLAAEYPASHFASPLAAYTELWSDGGFVCQSEWLADAAADHQSEPVYRFVYDHTYSGPLAPFGAGHGLDLYLVFHNTPQYLVFDAAEGKLSDDLIAAWSRFAHAGDTGWARRTAAGHERMLLDHELHAAAASSDRCRFWWPLIHGRR